MCRRSTRRQTIRVAQSNSFPLCTLSYFPVLLYYSNNMRVLAFDPGYDRLGVAVVERSSGKEALVHSTCVTTERGLSIPDRLCVIGEAVDELMGRFMPDVVALETLFFNKNQKTAIGVAEVRGIIIYLARHYHHPVMEFGPQEIKIAVTGYGKSDKTAVISMVKRLISNVPVSALDDEYDAIAVGVTAIAHSRTNIL
jgi:crossover junction endodeoxyribonuclease RuvC